MKKIKKLLMPITGVACLSSCVVPLAACSAQEVVSYGVTVKQHAGVAINCDSSVIKGKDLTFTCEFLDGYELDEDASSITIGSKSITEGYQVKENEVTIPASLINGAIVINIVPKQSVEYYTVTCKQYGNVEVIASPIALVGKDFTFSLAFDEGYILKELIVEVNGESYTPTLEQGVYTIPADDVTGPIYISAYAMASEYKVNEPEYNDHIRYVDVPKGAVCGQDLEGTVIMDNYYHFDADNTYYEINGEKHALTPTLVEGIQYKFTIPGEAIKGDVTIHMEAVNDDNFELLLNKLNINDAYMTKMVEGQPAVIYAYLKDGFKLDENDCHITLGTKDLIAGTDYVVDNDSIVITAQAVNNYLAGSDDTIHIYLSGVETITLTYTDKVGDGHFRTDTLGSDKFAMNTPKAGENLVIDVSNRDVTNWYGLEKGYKIDPTNTTVLVNGTALTDGYIINDNRYINQIVISGHQIPENASIEVQVAAAFIEPEFKHFELVNETEITSPSPLVTCSELKKTGTTYTLEITPASPYSSDDLEITMALDDEFSGVHYDVPAAKVTWSTNKWIVDISDFVTSHSGAIITATCVVSGKEIVAEDPVITGDLETAKITFTKATPAYSQDLVYTYTLTDVTDSQIMIDTSKIKATYTLGSGTAQAIPSSAVTLVRNTNGGTITIDGDYVKYGYDINLSINFDKAWHIDPSENLGNRKYVSENDTTVEAVDPSNWTGADYFDNTIDGDYVIKNVDIHKISTGTTITPTVQFRWDNTAIGVFEHVDVGASYVTFSEGNKTLTIKAEAFELLRTSGTSGARVTNFYIYTSWTAA